MKKHINTQCGSISTWRQKKGSSNKEFSLGFWIEQMQIKPGFSIGSGTRNMYNRFFATLYKKYLLSATL